MRFRGLLFALLFGWIIFCRAASAQTFQVLHQFAATPEDSVASYDVPQLSALTLVADKLYGTTLVGGSGFGTVFSIGTNGTSFSILHTFPPYGFGETNMDGANPNGGVVFENGTLYGTASRGGVYKNGTLFSLSANGSNFEKLHDFAGGIPGGLVQSGNTLYGILGGSYTGSSANDGYIFAIQTDGSNYRIIHTFTPAPSGTNSDGGNPVGPLVLTGNILYGTTAEAGAFGGGTVFSVSVNGNDFKVLHHFTTSSPDVGLPQSGLVLVGNTLYGTETGGVGFAGGAIYAIATDGTGYRVLHDFSTDLAGGSNPQGGLAASGHTLYGATYGQGIQGYGTLYSLETSGENFIVQHSFAPHSPNSSLVATNAEGGSPFSTLVVEGGMVYGLAQIAGPDGGGTLFSLSSPLTAPDTIPPVLTILTPSSNQAVAGSSLTAFGTAEDNIAVGAVFWRLNDGEFDYAARVNGSPNWNASLAPVPGTNILQAFAADTSGNLSRTSTVTFISGQGAVFTNVFLRSTSLIAFGSGGIAAQAYRVVAHPIS